MDRYSEKAYKVQETESKLHCFIMPSRKLVRQLFC